MYSDFQTIWFPESGVIVIGSQESQRYGNHTSSPAHLGAGEESKEGAYVLRTDFIRPAAAEERFVSQLARSHKGVKKGKSFEIFGALRVLASL